MDGYGYLAAAYCEPMYGNFNGIAPDGDDIWLSQHWLNKLLYVLENVGAMSENEFELCDVDGRQPSSIHWTRDGLDGWSDSDNDRYDQYIDIGMALGHDLDGADQR